MRKVKDLEFSRWYPDQPVEINSGIIYLEDNDSEVALSLIFFNVSNKEILSVYFSIRCYDDAGDPVIRDGSNTIDYAYMEINLKPKVNYGENIFIKLTGVTVRKIEVYFIKAVFSDGSVVRAPRDAFSFPIPGLPKINDLDCEYKNHLFETLISGSEKEEFNFEFIPVQINKDIWACSCGRLNRSDNTECDRCGLNKEWMFKVINEKYIMESLEEYKEKLKKAEEIKNKEEYERKIAEKELKKKKDRIKLITAITVAIIVTIATSIPLVSQKIKYRHAKELLHNGQYLAAVDAFSDLGSYKDSKSLIIEGEYEYACELITNKDYDNAQEILKPIIGYKDSKDKLKECYYLKGLEAFDRKEYLAACSTLLNTVDYKDSNVILLKSYYEEYKQNKEFNYIQNAYGYLAKITGIDQNNNQIIDEIKKEYYKAAYSEAIRLYDNRYFVEARELFKIVDEYYDTKKYLNSPYYKIEGKWASHPNETNPGFMYTYRLLEGGMLAWQIGNEISPFELYWDSYDDYSFGYYRSYSSNTKIVKIDDGKQGKLVLKDDDGYIRTYYLISKSTLFSSASVRKQKPIIGMSEYEVKNSSWGLPKKINRTTTAYGVSGQWVYSGNKYVYLDNGIVTAIQD